MKKECAVNMHIGEVITITFSQSTIARDQKTNHILSEQSTNGFHLLIKPRALEVTLNDRYVNRQIIIMLSPKVDVTIANTTYINAEQLIFSGDSIFVCFESVGIRKNEQSKNDTGNMQTLEMEKKILELTKCLEALSAENNVLKNDKKAIEQDNIEKDRYITSLQKLLEEKTELLAEYELKGNEEKKLNNIEKEYQTMVASREKLENEKIRLDNEIVDINSSLNKLQELKKSLPSEETIQEEKKVLQELMDVHTKHEETLLELEKITEENRKLTIKLNSVREMAAKIEKEYREELESIKPRLTAYYKNCDLIDEMNDNIETTLEILSKAAERKSFREGLDKLEQFVDKLKKLQSEQEELKKEYHLVTKKLELKQRKHI